MPRTKVVLFREESGSVPLLQWLASLGARPVVKIRVRLERLAELGHELRRPEADYLRDGIYELRIGLEGINYRILYFYHGNVAAVVSHGIVKEARVPAREIELALSRKKAFEADPEAHSYLEG